MKTSRPAGPLRVHLVSLVCAALLPVLVFGVVLAALFARGERVETERELRAAARALSLALPRESETHVRSLQILATADELDRRDLGRFHALAARAVEASPAWEAVMLVDPGGEQLVGRPAPPGPRGFRRRAGGPDVREPGRGSRRHRLARHDARGPRGAGGAPSLDGVRLDGGRRRAGGGRQRPGPPCDRARVGGGARAAPRRRLARDPRRPAHRGADRGAGRRRRRGRAGGRAPPGPGRPPRAGAARRARRSRACSAGRRTSGSAGRRWRSCIPTTCRAWSSASRRASGLPARRRRSPSAPATATARGATSTPSGTASWPRGGAARGA